MTTLHSEPASHLPAAYDPPTDLSIGQVSRLLGLTPRAIRYYEEKGLVRSYRFWRVRTFSANDFHRLSLISSWRRAGLGLEEIHEILEAYTEADGGKRQNALVKRQLERRLRDLEAQRALIEQAMARLDNQRLPAPSPPRRALDDAAMPPAETFASTPRNAARA